MEKRPWYKIDDEDQVPSPSLLVYPDRIEKNIETMIRMTGEPAKLRPHVKTHKMAEVIRLQMKYGIEKYKCATLAEADLLGKCGAPDVLLAMQPVGPNIGRFLDLYERYPNTIFSTLVDCDTAIREIGSQAENKKVTVSLYLDLNLGMNRTGIAPSEDAIDLYRQIVKHDALRASGLHAYDGHIRNSVFERRKEECDKAFEAVTQMKHKLQKQHLPVEEIIAGGSPTFPIHAKREGVIASPGTTLLWDARYGESFPEMDFLVAAVLLTRVVSKPAKGIICLDLGHKSVAPEMDFPRVWLPELENSEQIGQSEEHLVVRTGKAHEISVGTVLYAIPMHICPTVAKYPQVMTVSDKKVTGDWEVAARDHHVKI